MLYKMNDYLRITSWANHYNWPIKKQLFGAIRGLEGPANIDTLGMLLWIESRWNKPPTQYHHIHRHV